MENYNLPENMTAVVLTGTNNQYEIRHDVPVPSNPGYQEVICKVMSIAICGTDPKLLKGKPYHYCPENYPFIIGHEWSGIVVKTGPGVYNLKAGDRVAGEAHRGCGFCKNCKEGRYSLCLNYGNPAVGHRHYGFTTFGAYAQYVQYHIGSLTKLPDNVSFEEAAMCDTAGVAYHGITRAGVTPGGTVCVIGPGPIGLMSMKIARCLGASHVIAIGRGARLKAAVAMGACDPDKAIDFEEYKEKGWSIPDRILELTQGIGPDEVFEASGAIDSMAQAIEITKKGGKIVLLGTPPENTMVQIPMKKITFKELTVFGSRGNPNATEAIVNLMSSGQLKVKELVTHTFPLTQFTDGMQTFIKRKDGAIKVIFYPNN